MQKYNIFPKKLRAIFFDMDGVLYDSMPNHAITWVESFRQAGIIFPEYDAYLNEGRTGSSTIEIAFKQYSDREATEEDIEAIYSKKTELMLSAPESPLMPGMQEVVEKTIQSGLDIIVVTGSRQPSLLSRLKKDYNINSDKIISGFDVKKGKPDPEPYLMALEKSGHSSDQVIVVENAPLGVQSAVAANIHTIAVNTGILKPEELEDAGASIVLPDTLELLKFWDKIVQ